MFNFNLKLVLIALAIGLMFAACGGKGDSKQQESATTETQTEQSAPANNDNLFDVPADQITFGSSLDKSVVLAEIPKEMFKGVGKVNSVEVWANSIGSFKYNVVLKFHVKSNENSVKALIDYYRSIGATVEETGNRYNPYSVKFEWGEATEIKFGSFEGQDYVDMQFGVVQK